MVETHFIVEDICTVLRVLVFVNLRLSFVCNNFIVIKATLQTCGALESNSYEMQSN